MKTFPLARIRSGARRALTQVEMLVTLAVVSVLCAAIVVGTIMIQRSFRASEKYVGKEASQMRLLDYLSLDLRRALTVSSNNQTGTIELTMPDFYQSDGAPRMPTIKSGMAHYGNPNAPVRVRYYRKNGQLVREQNSQVTNVASDVQDFNVSFRDEGQVIEVRVSFIPTFRPTGGSREGTTTVCRTLLRNKRQS